MTYHRAESHALFWLTLAAPPIAWAVARISREAALFRRWWLAVWLVLITHPLLDAMTVYGTQLLLPFTDRPFGVGSIFIIDPMYTLPLLVGVVAALRLTGERGLAWNRAGLAFSFAYLAWSAAAQGWVRHETVQALQSQGIASRQLLVTPAPFSTVLWRVVAITPDDHYVEGFHSLLDDGRPMRFEAFPRGGALLPDVADNRHVQRMVWFTRGFYKLERTALGVVITDLRMGQEPDYVFAFRVTQPRSMERSHAPQAVGQRGDLERGLRWLGPRMLGVDLPPPR